MNSFLNRLVHPIKALRAERDSLIACRVEMEDEIRRIRSEIEILRDERDTARSEALTALRAIADWMAELRFGKRIFDTAAPPLPENNESDLTSLNLAGRSRVRGRDVVNKMTKEFYEQYDTAAAAAGR